MKERVTWIFSSEARLAKMVFAGLLVLVFGFVFGSPVYAQFVRSSGSAGVGYGYGYGYGYGFGADHGANGQYKTSTSPSAANTYGQGYGYGALVNVTLTPISTASSETIGTVVTFTASGATTDPNGTVAYSLSGAPAGATINASSGAFSWDTTTANYQTYNFSVVATGSSGGSASQTLSITINATGSGGGGGSTGGGGGGIIYSSGGGGGSGTVTTAPQITPTSGSSLTPSQIDAIISLLQSFGADPAVIANVRASLWRARLGRLRLYTGSHTWLVRNGCDLPPAGAHRRRLLDSCRCYGLLWCPDASSGHRMADENRRFARSWLLRC